jgi:hypothetical protein
MIDVTMGSAVVPIKLSSFTGNKMGKNNQLNWVTTTEINNLGFEIQRSNDGKEFKKIGFIESKGNQSTVLNYTFSDALPLNGINYYRLRQIDKDNKETFSEIISIRNNEVETIEVISLYPNPTKGNIGIAFNSISNDKYVLQIIDITGKIVSKQYIDAQQGRNNLQMNTSFLNSGNYVVKILGNNNEEFASTVFIKQ